MGSTPLHNTPMLGGQVIIVCLVSCVQLCRFLKKPSVLLAISCMLSMCMMISSWCVVGFLGICGMVFWVIVVSELNIGIL